MNGLLHGQHNKTRKTIAKHLTMSVEKKHSATHNEQQVFPKSQMYGGRLMRREGNMKITLKILENAVFVDQKSGKSALTCERDDFLNGPA